jgi:hypothetical protein
MSSLKTAKDNEFVRDESRGRRAYVLNLLAIFIALPIAANIVANAIGVDINVLNYITKPATSSEAAKFGFGLNLIPVWYIQLPLFIYFTRLRVLDAGLNQWLTILFVLPFVNLLMWFWPTQKHDRT